MSDSESFTFTEVGDGDEGWVCVRVIEGGTGLAPSTKTGGDLKVFMPAEAVRRLVAALSATSSA